MRPTRLPDKPVKAALISGEIPELAQALEKMAIVPVTTDLDIRLPKPVCWHPDMQAAILHDGTVFVTKGGLLAAKLQELGISVMETSKEPEPRYPCDVLCNVLVWEGKAVGNPKTIDQYIWDKLNQVDFFPVRQGYTACSTALIDANSVITGDPGIATALKSQGMDVLTIRPGFIRLSGYRYGLFGGCCALLAPGLLGVAGTLDSHPDSGQIRSFLLQRGVSVLELLEGPLTDVGGILPLA